MAAHRSIYRVVVRGRFVDLTPRARAMLAGNVAEHDLFSSAFTAEGTLTYDEKLDFFNLRYEIRDADGPSAAEASARTRAEAFLDVLGVGHTIRRVTAMDLAEMTDR